jgi:hypothetical protein
MELKEKSITFIRENATTLLHKVSLSSWLVVSSQSGNAG